MTIPIRAANLARPGQPVPSNRPWAQSFHIITDVQVEDQRIRITTNEGSWSFAAFEDVNFPRRFDYQNEDGSWVYGPFKVWLPNETTLQALKINDLIESGRDVWTVRRISRSGPVGYIVVTVSNGRVTKTFSGYYENPIPVITEDSVTSYARNIPVPALKYTIYGPYYDRDAEEVVMLAVHPNGRGRWPAELGTTSKGIIQPLPGLYIKRPPRNFFNTVFVGESPFDRHPKDPGWGDIPADPVLAATFTRRIAEVSELVDKYRATEEEAPTVG